MSKTITFKGPILIEDISTITTMSTTYKNKEYTIKFLYNANNKEIRLRCDSTDIAKVYPLKMSANTGL